MIERNFESELKIEVAAQDSDLRAFFGLEIFNATHAVAPARAEIIEGYSIGEVLQLRADFMRGYDLGESQMPAVIGRCVADIAGIQVGRDFFRGDET